MINSILARLTDTPKFERGMRAYDVRFNSPEGEGYFGVLTRGDSQLGEQIRQTLFTAHPEATDYTFRQFDYLDFQRRVFINNAIHNQLHVLMMGENFIDEAEL